MTLSKKFMNKNVEKNCFGVKIVLFFPKIWSFEKKKIVLHFVRFLAIFGAPLSSELLNTLFHFQNNKYNSQEKPKTRHVFSSVFCKDFFCHGGLGKIECWR